MAEIEKGLQAGSFKVCSGSEWHMDRLDCWATAFALGARAEGQVRCRARKVLVNRQRSLSLAVYPQRGHADLGNIPRIDLEKEGA